MSMSVCLYVYVYVCMWQILGMLDKILDKMSVGDFRTVFSNIDSKKE